MTPDRFAKWFADLDKIGIAEGIFDSPRARFRCTGSYGRRPYAGEDGLYYQCFQSGMTPMQALGETFVEQDAEIVVKIKRAGVTANTRRTPKRSTRCSAKDCVCPEPDQRAKNG